MEGEGSVPEQMSHVVLATVRPLSLGFGAYLAYTVAREWNDYQGAAFYAVVGADILSALYLLGLAAWVWLRPPRLSWMNGLGASVGVALAGTDMVTMAVNGIPAFPATALVFAGLGAVVLSWRWLLGTLALLWVAWIVVAVTFTPDPWAAQFILQVSTVVGLAIHGGRMRAYRGLIEARLNEAASSAKLRRANEELDRFASVVAHDLQNPVAAIRLKAAALRIRAPEGDLMQRATLQELDRVADGMSRLINDLLAYARAGQAGQVASNVDLDDIAAEVRTVFEERMQADGGQLETRNLPVVLADPTLMFQLLENLVGNAVSHARPGVPPMVTITGRREQGGLAVLVQDNGAGFDPSTAERLFEPFERGDTDAPGHGLGLATCRRIVERHGGRLSADSVPGHGSVFKVWLPDRVSDEARLN